MRHDIAWYINEAIPDGDYSRTTIRAGITKMSASIYSFIIFTLFFYGCSTLCVQSRYRPKFHLAPPKGWMNDPNGFCYFQGYYHLFYQYNPESSQEPGIAHWGHARSKDMFHWEELPIAMYPDQPYDKTGVFSGSAIVENDTMYLYYTGNVNHPGETPDHEQHQALATSTDGIKVTKYEKNPIIEGADRQPNFRDPKVWKRGTKYYMVLGNSFNNDTLGRVLLYESEDMINWKEVSILAESNGFLGYMWECPDFFEIGGYYVLLFSPQGIKPQGDMYRNLYQTGYIVGEFDYETYEFEPITQFKELDFGHDFYATQTIEDPEGRRLLVAWFDMWEEVYPERNDGWTGQMTVVRELSLSPSYRLIQKPIREIAAIESNLLHLGYARGGTKVKLDDNAARILITSDVKKDLEIKLQSESGNGTVTIKYECKKGRLSLDRGGEDGVRRTRWRPKRFLVLEIFVDSSSIEIFAGYGEVTFSSRFFPDGTVTFQLADKSTAEVLHISQLSKTVATSTDACGN